MNQEPIGNNTKRKTQKNKQKIINMRTLKKIKKTFKNFIRTNFDIKIKVLSAPSVIICLTKIPTLKQSEFVAKARLAEEQILKEELTWNKGKSRSFRVEAQRPTMSTEVKQNWIPENINYYYYYYYYYYYIFSVYFFKVFITSQWYIKFLDYLQILKYSHT